MSKDLGPVCQNGYIVKDIEKAMDEWIKLGVGPWFYVENAMLDNFKYKGQPHDIEMKVALANSGDVQIELIQQTNDVPSMYQDFLNSGREGFQHIAYWTEDYDAMYQHLQDQGFSIVHEGQIGGPQGRMAYFDTEHVIGIALEISELAGSKKQIFDYIKKASIGWNGSKPIRKL